MELRKAIKLIQNYPDSDCSFTRSCFIGWLKIKDDQIVTQSGSSYALDVEDILSTAWKVSIDDRVIK